MLIENYIHPIEKRYRTFFEQHQIDFDFMVDVELVLLAFYESTKGKVKPEEAWSILTGHHSYEKTSLSPFQLRMIRFLQLRYKRTLASKSRWHEVLEMYKAVPMTYRLFLFDEKTYSMQRPARDLYKANQIKEVMKKLLYPRSKKVKDTLRNIYRYSEKQSMQNIRLFVYYQILKAIPKFEKNSSFTIPTNGTYRYFDGLPDSDYKEFQVHSLSEHKENPEYERKLKNNENEAEDNEENGNVPTLNRLDRFKIKSTVIRKETFQRSQNAAEMKKVYESNCDKNGDKWINQVARTDLEKKPLVYQEGKIHITGGVGVGKNSFIEEEIFRILKTEKRNDVRICVILRSIASCLSLHETLLNLGIENVSVVPGLYSKEKHEENYMENLLENSSNFNDILKYKETLDMVDASCLFSIYQNKTSQVSILPCVAGSFKKEVPSSDGAQEWKTSVCPFVNECGLMKTYLSMQQNNVWIMTPHALKQTSLPYFIDKEKRTLQKLVHDLVDIVYFDEVDETMDTYTRSAVIETTASGNEKEFNRALVQNTRNSLYNGNLVANDTRQLWIDHLNKMESAILQLYSLFQTHEDFHHSLHNKQLNIFQIGSNLLDYIQFSTTKSKEMHKENLFGFLINYEDTRNKRFLRVLDKTMNELFSPKPRKEKREITKQFFTTMKWNINSRKSMKNTKNATEFAELYLELLTYVSFFERNLRKLVSIYPIISDELRLSDVENTDFQNLFGSRNKLLDILETNNTGRNFGYRFSKNDGDSKKPIIQIVRYNGETRNLLLNWHELLSFYNKKWNAQGEIISVKGPCLVGLSGTSYAPESPHFDVDFGKNYRLINTGSQPKVEIYKHFAPSLKEKSDYLHVSGSGKDRADNLREIIEYISGSFQQELDHWAQINPEEKRKILIVVSSYRDAKIVAKKLNTMPQWKSKFCFVYKDFIDEQELRKKAIKPNRIESFSQYQEDILIAPLPIISRGYNVVFPSGKSYFGSMFLCIRPYYIVDDLNNIYLMTNARIKEWKNKQSLHLQFESYMNALYQETNLHLFEYLTKPLTTMRLSQIELKELAWYCLILVQQAVGRLLRGDTDARLIIVDASMDYISEEKREKQVKSNKQTSMIEWWKLILQEYEKNEIIQDLYGLLGKGLADLKKYK